MKALQFWRVSVDHNGGTKSYHMAWISCGETGKSILMKRWGKTGQFGAVSVERFADAYGAEHVAMKQLAAKRRKGYGGDQWKTAGSNDTTPQSFFGLPVWNAFGPTNLDFLDANIRTAGMPNNNTAPRYDEDGDPIPPRKPNLVQVDPAEELRLKREAEQRELSGNPLYGMF